MIMPDAARYRMPWGNSWRKRADQRCSAISFWTRHPPNWARHRVDHGTITGRGGDKFGARKAVFACNGCAFSPRPPREKIVRVMSAGVQTQCVYKNLALLSFNLLARIIAMRIDVRPPFSALFTLWLSIIAAVGLASRSPCSRHSTYNA